MSEVGAKRQAECSHCRGAGALSYEDRDVRTVTHGTSLCVCRMGLQPREGKAAWWTAETALDMVIETLTGLNVLAVRVRPEVPVSEDNYRVVRRGNRYWPTLVDLYIDDQHVNLFPSDARLLAAALVKAADVSDGIDSADADTCGHWAECDCVAKVVGGLDHHGE